MTLLPTVNCKLDVDVFWYDDLQLKDMEGAEVFKHLASFVLNVLVFPPFKRLKFESELNQNKASEQTDNRHSQWILFRLWNTYSTLHCLITSVHFIEAL